MGKALRESQKDPSCTHFEMHSVACSYTCPNLVPLSAALETKKNSAPPMLVLKATQGVLPELPSEMRDLRDGHAISGWLKRLTL